MSKDEKALPEPPATPFSRKRSFDKEEDAPLMADKITAAMAEGRLEEFIQKELPDNEQTRALVSLMLQMTGMMPPEMPQAAKQEEKPEAAGGGAEGVPPASNIPEDILKAVNTADVAGLVGLLRREHEKKTQAGPLPEAKEESSHKEDKPVIEKEIIDNLIRIASDNQVTVDWLILRALKLYVEDFRITGRL